MYDLSLISSSLWMWWVLGDCSFGLFWHTVHGDCSGRLFCFKCTGLVTIFGWAHLLFCPGEFSGVLFLWIVVSCLFWWTVLVNCSGILFWWTILVFFSRSLLLCCSALVECSTELFWCTVSMNISEWTVLMDYPGGLFGDCYTVLFCYTVLYRLF